MFPKRKNNYQGAAIETDVEVVLPTSQPEPPKEEPRPLPEPEPLRETAVAPAVEKPNMRAADSIEKRATPAEEATLPELERLREILFGGQARATEKRLSDLETRLTALRQEIRDLLDKRANIVSETADAQLNQTARDLNNRLTQQATEQATQLRTAQQTLVAQIQAQEASLATQIRTNRRELSDRLDSLEAEHTNQLRAIQQELNQRMDTLSADFLAQLRQVQKELSERLDQLNSTYNERVLGLQAETRQRDDALRQELLLLASQLDDRKVSRRDMGQMLMEMGMRLRAENS